MKNLIFINGTMGVGKTATSRELQKILPNCVFLTVIGAGICPLLL